MRGVVRAVREGVLLQIACHAAGVAVMVLGLRKLPEVATSERDIFFGVVMVMTLGLLMIVVGMLVEVLFWQKKQGARLDEGD